MTEKLDDTGQFEAFSFKKKPLVKHLNISNIHSVISDIIPQSSNRPISANNETNNQGNHENAGYNDINYDEQIRAPRMSSITRGHSRIGITLTMNHSSDCRWEERRKDYGMSKKTEMMKEYRMTLIFRPTLIYHNPPGGFRRRSRWPPMCPIIRYWVTPTTTIFMKGTVARQVRIRTLTTRLIRIPTRIWRIWTWICCWNLRITTCSRLVWWMPWTTWVTMWHHRKETIVWRPTASNTVHLRLLVIYRE